MDAEEQFLSGACIYNIFAKSVSQTYMYEVCDKNKEEIIKEHVNFCSKFKIDIEERVLPFLQYGS